MTQLPIHDPRGPAPMAAPAYGTGESLDLKTLLEVLRRRKLVFLQTFIAVLVIGIAGTMLSKTVYETEVKLLVPTVSSSVNVMDASNPLAAMLAYSQPESVTAQAQVLQSPTLQEQAKKDAKVANRRSVVPPSIKVQVLKEGSTITNVIGVTVSGGDPAEIAKLGNTLAYLHIKRTQDLQNDGLKKTIKNIAEQTRNAQIEFRQKNTKLRNFRRHYNVERLSAEQKARGERLVDLQTQLDQAQGEIVSTQEQIRNLRAVLDREPMDLAKIREIDNPLIPQIEEKIRQLEIQRATLLQTFLPESDDVKEVDEQIAELRKKLESAPPSQRRRTFAPNPRYDALTLQLSQLEGSLLKSRQEEARAAQALAEQQALTGDSNSWELQLNELTEDRDQARARFVTLTERLQDLNIRKEASLATVRILELAAIPTEPVRPNRPLLLALTLLFAIALATATAFVNEFLDDRLRNSEDVQRVFSLPTLALVPMVEGGKSELLSALPSHSNVAEAYRGLRSGIGFAGIDSPIRRLQVTSALKGEGKSTTSTNLASVVAMGGKRVILVDTDLRRPSVHRILELPQTPGLTEVLVGTATLDEAIQSTGTENLWVISAGSIPPNPTELLSSQAFERLVQQLDDRADMVIFDTPPCIPVSDPTIVAGQMDAVLLVVNSSTTRRPIITQALELLNRARARVLGVVLNRIDTRNDHQYYQYYGGYEAETPQNGAARKSSPRPHSNGTHPDSRLARGEALGVGGRDED